MMLEKQCVKNVRLTADLLMIDTEIRECHVRLQNVLKNKYLTGMVNVTNADLIKYQMRPKENVIIQSALKEI